MKLNKDVVDAFYKGKKARNTNMLSTGFKLYSWDTCIAQNIDGKIIKNITKYSISTSRQQKLITKYDYIASNVPFGTSNLKPYI